MYLYQSRQDAVPGFLHELGQVYSSWSYIGVLLSDLIFQPHKANPRAPFKGLDFCPEILDLMNAFPLGLTDTADSKCLFTQYLPSREQAVKLSDLYYKHVAWA